MYKTIQDTAVPALGFGTYELKGDKCRRSVTTAIETGYRHIDTARAYDNEDGVGAALLESGVPRDEIFLTSKVWFEDLNFEPLMREIDASLRALRTDFLDLALVHWPNEEVPLEETFRALNRLQEEKVIRHFGVSNFTPKWLARALELGKVFCNQVEYHPLLRQRRLHQMALEHDLLLTAYAPLAQGSLHDNEVLLKIARRHDATAEQISLAWLLEQPNVAAIPRSGSPEHIRSNFQALEIRLDDEDRRQIDELPGECRQIDPDFAPAWDE
ncbi:MAG: aldo/keto reductase [Lysobacterales bacterium]